MSWAHPAVKGKLGTSKAPTRPVSGHLGFSRGVFILLIGSSNNSQFSEFPGLFGDVLCSLCSLGGGGCKATGVEVRGVMGSLGCCSRLLKFAQG